MSSKNRRSGFALVLTLIIVVLAAVTVVAFLTTAVTERTTAVAYGHIDKADLFAEAGVDAAIARLTTEMQYRPYHAIGYRVVNNGMNNEVVPVITGPRTTTPATTATYNTAPGPDVYLVSTIDAAGADPPGSTAPTGLTTTNSVDLNNNHLSTEPRGWIGSPTTSVGILPYRVSWIDILRDPTQPEQHTNPDAADYNPVIGRYAYWIEDETSKLDVSQIGNKESGGAFQRGDGVDLPLNNPPKLAVNDLDLGALPLVGSSPLPGGDIQTNGAIIDFRTTMPMLDARFLNRVGGALTPNVHETAKFYTTVFGLSNDLAGNGRRRANINALVTSPANSNAAVPPATIAGNIDDIVYVITGTHLVAAGLGPSPPAGARAYENAPVFTSTLTNFGARFFTAPTPTAAQKTMYLERIAANIRDYIDTDSQPTIIDTVGPTVRAIGVPAHPIEASGGGTSGLNEVVAIGKERVPLIQEYTLRVREIAFSPRTGNFANYVISIDHYVEFWNTSNRDIPLTDLGPNPFLLIADQPGWDAGGLDDIPAGPTRDLKLRLNVATNSSSHAALTAFPAGSITVITTDPQPLNALTPDLTRVYYIPITPDNGVTGLRKYSGRTQKKSGSQLRLGMIGRPTASSTDYETEIALGNDFGLLESAWGAGAITSNISINIDLASPPENRLDDTKYHFRGASLRGNTGTSSPNATTGDPRTNAEQLTFNLNGGPTGNTDKTRYFDTGLDSSHIPGSSSLGAANTTYVNPANWPDSSSSTQSANAAPSVIANASLTSIGQLGDIFDPVRVVGDSRDITLSRSGGRTLKIGQPDDLNGVGAGTRTFSSNWFNSAWRLTDLFDAGRVADPTRSPQPTEMVSPPTSRGRVNINGVLRDSIDTAGNVIPAGGVALRAALRSFIFAGAPNSDPRLNGQTLSSADIDRLISSIQTYLKTNGPMMERGELSQLSFFSTSGSLAGQPIATTNDRGREEIFRRTIEMITTRSASFTVYAVGEAVRQDRNGNKVTVGQKRLASTLQLEPQVNGAPLVNSTLPHAVVDSYQVKRVYAPN